MPREVRTFVMLLMLTVCAIDPVAKAQEAGETVDVKAEGVGATAADAEKQAVLSAVQQAVGMFMDSETLVKNEEIVHDRVLSVSNGFVSSYNVTVPARQRRSDNLFTVSILAVVQKGKVGAELRKAHLISEAVDGANVWAEAATRVKSGKDGYDLLQEHLPSLAARLLRAQLVDASGKAGVGVVRPEIKPDPTSDAAICTWNIAVSFDRETYYREAVPMLQAALTAVADAKPGELITVNTPTEAPGGPQGRGRRVAILGTPLRFFGHGELSGVDLPEWGAREQMAVLLNTRRDKAAQQQRYQCFILEQKTYLGLFQGSFGAQRLKIEFLDESGNVLHEGNAPLDTLLLARMPPKGAAPVTDAVDAEKIRLTPTPLALFRRLKPGVSAWVTPEFFPAQAVYGFSTAVDALLIRYQISLSPDDLKAFRKVQFSFEPVNNPRGRTTQYR